MQRYATNTLARYTLAVELDKRHSSAVQEHRLFAIRYPTP